METVWQDPIYINDGVFITSENGEFKMYKLERGSFILPISGEEFTDDVLEFIKTHYKGYKFAQNKDDYIKNTVDKSDSKVLVNYLD